MIATALVEPAMKLALGDSLFDEDETLFRWAIRAWLEEHPPPARPTDLDRAWMDDFMAWSGELARAGYWALAWPREFGGAELPIGHQLVQIEELARAQVDPKILMAGVGLVGPLLMRTGTTEQQQRHLDRILNSLDLWCMLLSEPGAGSDLAAVSTRAVLEGDELRITGHKTWASRAHLSNYGMLLCRTGGSPGKVAGLTMVILDLSSPGVSLIPLQQLTGSAEFNEVYLEDVVVPVGNVVGQIDHGWTTLLGALSAERTGLSLGGYAMHVEISTALAELARHADSPVRRDAFARVWSGVIAQRLTAMRTASTSETGSVEALASASVAKLHFGQNARAIAELAFDMYGVRGIADQPKGGEPAWPVRALLRSPADTIGGGTSDIQKNTIAERILGLPR